MKMEYQKEMRLYLMQDRRVLKSLLKFSMVLKLETVLKLKFRELNFSKKPSNISLDKRKRNPKFKKFKQKDSKINFMDGYIFFINLG